MTLLTRRGLMEAGAVGVSTMGSAPAIAAPDPQLNVEIHTPDTLEYLTKDSEFGTVERGNPLPYKLPEPRLHETGMTRDSWTLEVLPDLATGTRMQAPMSNASGTALTFAALLKLAETRAVRFLKVITCNNLNAPLGMGLWEGVPLRDVLWLAKPVSDIRRVIYFGHHNDDPKQMFQGTLPLGRVLEDPPAHNPVILAYKMNGEWLTGKRGGPVRMIVPEAYGFKSVKWIQRVVLTNLPGANDTYADENNDIDSWMKSCARLLSFPQETKAGATIKVTGVAQVGISGVSKVQYWLQRADAHNPPGDAYFAQAPWQDAELHTAPVGGGWGGGLPAGEMTSGVRGFDASGKPTEWPQRYTILHWSANIKGVARGIYTLRCRTIDFSGVAQPMPRPLPKSGMNAIEEVEIKVT